MGLWVSPKPSLSWFRADRYIDDAEAYDGAPVGVQLVGRRLQEEKMLTLAEYLGEEIAQDAEERV